jgi:trk system potassium uptake protein TrkA/voltage-gated potassium channel
MLEFLASPLRNFIGGLIVLFCIVVVATLAYMANGWGFADSLYMVVITVYTVGFGEVRPVDTTTLRLITMALIVSGSTTIIFITGALVQLITASQFQLFFGSRRMQKDIEGLSGHVIICGFGRIGQMLAKELQAAKCAFVIVERNEDRLLVARGSNYLCVQGDATDEDCLITARVAKARALATVLPDDAANVFITLSARSLNRDVMIIARGELPSTEGKLIKAGADRVVLPARIGAERVAELLLYDHVHKALAGAGGANQMTGELRRLGLDLEVVVAEAGSPCAGANVAQAEFLGAGSFLVVAIERAGGAMVMQPGPDIMIEAGDGVAIVARETHAQIMEQLFSAVKA